MTASTITVDITTDKPRPASRAARLSVPRTVDVLQGLAIEHGVCIRPKAMRHINPVTGRREVIDLRCGATRQAMCPPCAAKAKKLRQVQCREGWHRTDEPITPQPATDEQTELVVERAELEFAKNRAEQLGDWEQAERLQVEIDGLDRQILATGLRGRAVRVTERRVRSTRRRQDTPNLPRKRVENRTVGQSYVSKDGQIHRPSTMGTFTLPSYGPVRRDDSTPIDMDRYDYRRAALDAVHFPKLLDRLWQNLRRAIGWNIQYFGCIEPQKRLAPHAHFAIRGTFPRSTFRQVAQGTYHQVWQPSTDTIVFPEDGPQPEWIDHDGQKGYLSPWTGTLLPTWKEAMDALDAQIDAGEVGPAHVVRFGEQVHVGGKQHHRGDGDEFAGERPMGIEGMEAGSAKTEKAIGYITKYITKSVDECHQRITAREIEHHRRFQEALRYTPCSPRCANWLRYGIQPKKARPGMLAGRCRGRVHQAATLGIGGRRILVSRDWSGKTLSDHKADQNAWVRKVLALGLEHERPAGDQQAEGDGVDQDGGGDGAGVPVMRWERLKPHDRDLKPLHQRLWRSLGEKIRRRNEWQTALARLQQNGPPELVVVSATPSRAAPS